MSFRLKLSLSILSVVTTYVAAFTWLMLRRELLVGIAGIEENLVSHADLLESAVAVSLLTFDYGAVDTAAARLSELQGVLMATVFTPAGDMISQHGSTQEADQQALSGAAQYLFIDPSGSSTIERQITATNDVVGSLFIVADLSELSSRINDLAAWGLIVGIIGCLAVMTTSWFVAALLGRRINWLATGARQIANGDLQFRLRVPGKDELANIGDAIDNMADSLIDGRDTAERMARSDPLTDLLNRTGFAEALSQLNSAGRPITVLHIDLDRFKLINDTQGHAAGDAVLKAIAAELSIICADSVALSRIGGDEFLVLLDLSPDDGMASTLGEHIIAASKRPVRYADTMLRVSASIGIAALPPGPHPEVDLEKLMVDADIALYQAKTAGRSCIATFDEEARAAREAEADLEWHVGAALRASEFVPYIQPQIDVVSGRIVGGEILARWQHPTDGILTPVRFFDRLRNMDVVEAIDNQVRAKALEWMASGDGDRPDRISLNLTPYALAQVGTATAFAKEVEAIGLSPEQVVVEVNENVILDSGGIVQENLDALIGRGHSLELDDFGTGSASLQNLTRLKVQTLKIDRSFVRNIDTDPVRYSIVAAIVGMARALDMRVLAEGVETAAEQDTLCELGCTTMQGFLYARPMPLAAYQDWARNWLHTRNERVA